MNKNVNLSELVLVAYASALSEHMVPTIVTPVFKNLKTGEFVYPPFRIVEGVVENATFSDCEEEFKTFVDRGEITAVEGELKAQENYQLPTD